MTGMKKGGGKVWTFKKSQGYESNLPENIEALNQTTPQLQSNTPLTYNFATKEIFKTVTYT